MDTTTPIKKRRGGARRPSYKLALELLLETDQSWIHEPDGSPDAYETVEAALVRDLFDRSSAQIRADLIKHQARQIREAGS